MRYKLKEAKYFNILNFKNTFNLIKIKKGDK